jgi:decaprenylphospho-beta-D-erythro-pentofuranosid-2-ulose 2-reductase
MKRIAILGATSAMAEAAARIWAREGAQFVLVGRAADRLQVIANNLKVLGATSATTLTLDVVTDDAAREVARINETLSGIDVALLAYGALGDQAEMNSDPKAAQDLLTTNFVSAASWCQAFANVLERQRSGCLVVIGSVAGDRGRQSNYLYGASKAGLGALTEGIAHRLAPSGARAVLIKPGFVITPMTAALDRKGPLWATADKLGEIIVAAANKGGPVVYAPSFWRLIMLVIRNVPAAIFHKTKL